MADTPKKAAKNKPIPLSTDAACVVPEGKAFVPVGAKDNDQLVWDKTNQKWKVIPYPADPKGEHWTAGPDGPFWEKPPGVG